MKADTSYPTMNYFDSNQSRPQPVGIAVKPYLPLNRPNRQTGAVLMVALIFLIALTMLGISALQATKFETRMAASTKEYNLAFENAERAVAEAVHYYKGTNLSQLPTTASFDATLPVSKITTGKAQYRIMKGGEKDASQYLQGGSVGAIFYLIEGKGNSKPGTDEGIEVTLYAGLALETPSNDPGSLNTNNNPTTPTNNTETNTGTNTETNTETNTDTNNTP